MEQTNHTQMVMSPAIGLCFIISSLGFLWIWMIRTTCTESSAVSFVSLSEANYLLAKTPRDES